MALTKTLDTITLRNLQTTCCIGPDAWSRPGKQQPIILTLTLHLDTSAAGATDDIVNTFSYGIMCKDILSAVEGGVFESMGALVEGIVRVAGGWPGVGLRVGVLATKALLRVEGGLGVERVFEREGEGWRGEGWEWGVRGLRCACVVGVNEHERGERQGVVVGLGVGGEGVEELGGDGVWRELVRGVCEVVEASSFQTLEALAALVAETCLRDTRIPRISVSVEKPSALAAVEGAGVEITRDRQWMMRREGRA